MVLLSQNENANVEQLIEDIDIKHCIFTVANIWNQMQQSTLQNSWHNLQIRPSINTTDTKVCPFPSKFMYYSC